MHKSEQALNFSIRIPSRDVFREALMQFLEMRWKSSTNSLIRPQPLHRPTPANHLPQPHDARYWWEDGGKKEKGKKIRGSCTNLPCFPLQPWWPHQPLISFHIITVRFSSLPQECPYETNSAAQVCIGCVSAAAGHNGSRKYFSHAEA